MRRTLQEEIAANKRASAIYSIVIMLLLVALGTVIVGIWRPDLWYWGTGCTLVVGIIVTVTAYRGGSGIILSISRAHPSDNQTLNNVAEEMALAAGIPKPQVYMIDDSAPNAFATGIDPAHSAVCFTSGIVEKLDRDELQGVMAHEISHIRNYDMRFMTVIALVAGLIPLLADFFLRMMWYGGGSRRRDRDDGNLQVLFLVIGIALAILAPLFALLLHMAVSRQREFLADASAAELTRYPQGLASALQKIDADPEPLEAANRATQHLYIVNPIKKRSLRSLFSTHPPTEERVARLRELMGTSDGQPR